jgi:hypothetical protein
VSVVFRLRGRDLGFWEDVKRGLQPEPMPAAPGSAQAERETPIFVSLAPSDALDAATMHMLARGFSLEARFSNSVTFAKHEGPNLFIGCLLFLLFVVPAIIYLALAGRDTRTTLAAFPVEEGSRLHVGGDNREGVLELRRWAEGFPAAAS